MAAHRRLLVSAGGIPIDVFWQGRKLPKDVWVPIRAFSPIAAGVKSRPKAAASSASRKSSRLQSARPCGQQHWRKSNSAGKREAVDYRPTACPTKRNAECAAVADARAAGASSVT